MHNEKEVKEDLLNEIRESTSLTVEEKTMWSDIFSRLAERQETILHEIAAKTSPPVSFKNNIYCGCTDLTQNRLGDNLYFMSIADDITNHDFSDVNITDNIANNNVSHVNLNNAHSDAQFQRDGKWYIMGIGYLDCEYEDVIKLCGRNKVYRGISSTGEFDYALVLKPALLRKEKLLYDFSAHYPSEIIVPYAPMLRRLVYIETQHTFSDALPMINLCLSVNGLDCLHCDWRAVWNVYENDSLIPNQNDGKFRYIMQQNEYIIPYNHDHDILSSDICNQTNETKYIEVSTHSKRRPNGGFLKIEIKDINCESQLSLPNLHLNIISPEKEPSLNRIYSQADLFAYMQSYRSFIHFKEASTQYVNGLKICAYELGYEYPEETDYFPFTERPTLYVIFEKDDKKYLFDRIVYVIHLLQKKFPEYLWKGGYLNE